MPSETTLKVFAYNVQMLDQLNSLEYKNDERAVVIANQLANSDYDVIIFSEAFDDGARKEMIKILQGRFPQRTAIVGNEDENTFARITGLFLLTGVTFGLTTGPFFAIVGAVAGGLLGWLTGGRPPKSDGGVFIMSRWPIVMQGQIVYKKSAAEERFGKKGVSWALINKEGFYFNVFGTHTQADAQYDSIRDSQFDELRNMYERVGLYWHPTLIGGDLNVDFCFDKDRCPGNAPRTGCCTTHERDDMFRRLGASLPRDLSRYTYTRDPANDLKQSPNGRRPWDPPVDDPPAPGLGTTLDYVLHASDSRPTLRPQPVRSSLETVRLRGVVDGRERDLSDHFAVLGTYTFPFKREDSPRFTGTWRCIKFNGQNETRSHRFTCLPFGASVVNELEGQISNFRIYQMSPGGENSGKIVFKNVSTNQLVEYDYTFNQNRGFEQYFIPGEVAFPRGRRLLQQRPRTQNELFLRNPTRSMLYAFESWLPVEIGDFSRGGPV